MLAPLKAGQECSSNEVIAVAQWLQHVMHITNLEEGEPSHIAQVVPPPTRNQVIMIAIRQHLPWQRLKVRLRLCRASSVTVSKAISEAQLVVSTERGRVMLQTCTDVQAPADESIIVQANRKVLTCLQHVLTCIQP